MSARRALTLPLGIDVGRHRVRVALARCAADGTPELIAVASRDRDTPLGPLLADAVRELRTRERRCVFGIGEPAAIVRRATFPPMRSAEFASAARFEAARLIDYPLDEAHVRVESVDRRSGETALGVVRKSVLDEIRRAAREAQLGIIAVDHAAFAIGRAVPQADAILDIGLHDTMLAVFGRAIPRTDHINIGGASFTRAIADALGTDAQTAERRKLAHGIAGCGEELRERLVERVALALVDCRASGYRDVRNLTLVGNAARLDGVAAAIERATAVAVTLAAFAPHVAPALPPDVLRAAAPDWCLAYGLSLWAAA